MNRSQAIVVAILAGMVLLVFSIVMLFLFFPLNRLFQSDTPPLTPTQPAAGLPTPTPTFPNFLPTSAPLTPTSSGPTATNTRVLSAESPTPRPPTATVSFKLPTRVVRPTATPTPTPEVTVAPPPPTLPPTQVIGPTPPRVYNISFKADETTLERGDCTDLKWEVTGADMVWLNEKQVSPSGEKEVCPREDKKYELKIQVPGSVGTQKKSITISVEDEDEDAADND